MRRKKRPDFLIVVTLFVGLGLLATVLTRELRKPERDASVVVQLNHNAPATR